MAKSEVRCVTEAAAGTDGRHAARPPPRGDSRNTVPEEISGRRRHFESSAADEDRSVGDVIREVDWQGGRPIRRLIYVNCNMRTVDNQNYKQANLLQRMLMFSYQLVDDSLPIIGAFLSLTVPHPSSFSLLRSWLGMKNLHAQPSQPSGGRSKQNPSKSQPTHNPAPNPRPRSIPRQALAASFCRAANICGGHACPCCPLARAPLRPTAGPCRQATPGP